MRGRIYFHDQFGFHDGGVGKKFLILINNPKNTEPYLFVKTTSQQKDKPNQYGCHFMRKVFFIPSRRSYFLLDTWVQFHEIYPFAFDKCIKLGFDKNLICKSKLPERITNQIINCLLRCSLDDIEPEYLKLIEKE